MTSCRCGPRRSGAASVALAACVWLGLASGASSQPCSITQQAASHQALGSALQFSRAEPARWRDALPFLREALRACPDNWDAVGLLAQALCATDQFEECAATCARVVQERHGGQLQGVEPAVLRAFGIASTRLRQWDRARAALEAARAADAGDTLAQRALVDLAAAMRRDPETRLAAGLALLSRRQFAAAADTLRGIVRDAPTLVAAWRGLGVAEASRGDAPAAMAAYETALGLDAQQHGVAVDLARLYLEAARYDSAEAVTRRAMASWDPADPQLPGMWCVLGKVLEKRDAAYQQASELFARAQHDSTWGEFATRELQRQRALLERQRAPRAAGGGG